MFWIGLLVGYLIGLASVIMAILVGMWLDDHFD